MKRPVVRVTVRSADGAVVHSETKSAFNSGVRASEAAVREIARAEGTTYEGDRPTSVKDENDRFKHVSYTRRWVSGRGRVLIASVEAERADENRAGLHASAKRSRLLGGGTLADYEAAARAQRQLGSTGAGTGTLATGHRGTVAMTPGGTIVTNRAGRGRWGFYARRGSDGKVVAVSRALAEQIADSPAGSREDYLALWLVPPFYVDVGEGRYRAEKGFVPVAWESGLGKRELPDDFLGDPRAWLERVKREDYPHHEKSDVGASLWNLGAMSARRRARGLKKMNMAGGSPMDPRAIAKRFHGQIVDVWVRSWGGSSWLGRFYAAPKTLYRLDEFYRVVGKYGDIRMYEGGRPGPITDARPHQVTAAEIFESSAGQPGKTDQDAIDWALGNLAESVVAKHMPYDPSLRPWVERAKPKLRGERLKEARRTSESWSHHVGESVKQWIEAHRAGRAPTPENMINHLSMMGMLSGASQANVDEIAAAYVRDDARTIVSIIMRLTGGHNPRPYSTVYQAPKEPIPLGDENSAGKKKGGKTDMVVAVYGDHSLYGASADPLATDPRYWMQLRIDDEPHALFYAKVPHDLVGFYDPLTKARPVTLVEALEKQGVSGEQWFDDGYEGWRAVAPYVKPKRPFYVSHEYDEHAGAWKRDGGEED